MKNLKEIRESHALVPVSAEQQENQFTPQKNSNAKEEMKNSTAVVDNVQLTPYMHRESEIEHAPYTPSPVA